MNDILDFFVSQQPHLKEFLILGFLTLGLFVLKAVKSKLHQETEKLFLNAVLSSIYQPAKSLILFLIFWFLLLLVVNVWQLNIATESYPALQLLVAIHVSWYGFRTVSSFEKQCLCHTQTGKLDRTAIIGFIKILRLVLTAVLAVVAFDLLGLDASGLIALGSVSGAALAFASKDLVANWFGGIMLYLDKPFKVGDWIRSPDKEIEGTVEYIGWRITKIRTFDKRPLYVPNSLFNNIAVENPSRMTHRRIKETIGIRYDDMQQVQNVVDDIQDYLNNSDVIAQDQVQIVNFNAFGASSLDILVYCMTVTTDWVTFHQHKQTVLLDIANIVEGHEAEFAFPTQTLHLEQSVEN